MGWWKNGHIHGNAKCFDEYGRLRKDRSGWFEEGARVGDFEPESAEYELFDEEKYVLRDPNYPVNIPKILSAPLAAEDEAKIDKL